MAENTVYVPPVIEGNTISSTESKDRLKGRYLVKLYGSYFALMNGQNRQNVDLSRFTMDQTAVYGALGNDLEYNDFSVFKQDDAAETSNLKITHLFIIEMDGYLVTAGVSEIEYIQMGEYENSI